MQWQAAAFFATPVFKLSLSGADRAAAFFESHLKDKVHEDEKYVQGELSHYHSRSNVFKSYPDLDWLQDQLEQAGTFVYRELMNYRKSGPMKTTNAWYNLCEVGGAQPMHNHVNCLLCGTFYLRADKNTKLQFEHPLANSSSHPELYDAPDTSPNPHGLKFHQRHAQVGLETGDCLFWPAHIKHGYTSNKTPGRLTLSFNLMPDTLNIDYQVRTDL